MSFSEMLLPEFDQEMANTRKTLERIPDDKLAWQPHAKSMAMGDLATNFSLNRGRSSSAAMSSLRLRRSPRFERG